MRGQHIYNDNSVLGCLSHFSFYPGAIGLLVALGLFRRLIFFLELHAPQIHEAGHGSGDEVVLRFWVKGTALLVTELEVEFRGHPLREVVVHDELMEDCIA